MNSGWDKYYILTYAFFFQTTLSGKTRLTNIRSVHPNIYIRLVIATDLHQNHLQPHIITPDGTLSYQIFLFFFFVFRFIERFCNVNISTSENRGVCSVPIFNIIAYIIRFRMIIYIFIGNNVNCIIKCTLLI